MITTDAGRGAGIAVCAVVALAFAAGCGDSARSGEAADAASAADTGGATEQAEAFPSELLVAHTAPLEEVETLPRDPEVGPLPDDPYVAEQIRLGYRIVRNAREHAAAYVGNAMSCANCHLNGGQRERALPFVGVAATFPQYRGRDGRLISLEDRIADCFERSMNGTRPPYDSREMMAVAAYITWLAYGQPVGESPPWRGLNRIASESLIPIDQLDVARGERAFMEQCLACHGADGQGVELVGSPKPGPLWGAGSWNDGAGAARIYTLAGYIRYAMPLTAPGTISDEDAQHIAAYINSHERPAFARKARDYPNGDVPVDAVYYPQRYERNPLAQRQ